jgi:hypothetical protein
MGRQRKPGFSKAGVVLEGFERGLLRVERADGQICLCRAEGISKVSDYRAGEKVRIGQAVLGRSIAHRERAPTCITTAALPIRPLSPMVRRAVDAALAAGESVFTIADHFGLDPKRITHR